MTGWIVLLILVLLLVLLSQLPLGVRLHYDAEGFLVKVRAGVLTFRVYPLKKKKPKKQKPALAEKHKKEPKEGQPGTLSRLMKLLPVVGQACGALRRKIRIDDLDLDLIWGGSNPAAIAIGYGQANAAMGMIWPILDHNFKVKRRNLRISMDYSRTQPGVEAAAALTMTVGQIVTLGVHYGVKALVTWIKSGKPARKKQEAMSHE